jgi:hypothetical protein
MAYTIYNTDGTTLLLLADNTVDQSATSLSLVGKNVNGYGQYMNNNFIKLLANSASSSGTPPRSPLIGQLWFDTTARRLKIYDGSFKPVTGASISGRDTPPTNPVSGDLWYDSTYYQLKLFYGAVWYTVGPAFPASVGENGWVLPIGNVQDSYLNNQQVTLMKNYGKTLGVISSASFTTTYFTSATSLLTTSTLDVVSGMTVFGSIQATKNVKIYNTLTVDTIASVTINNSKVLTSKSLSITGTATSTSTTTGALVIAGGIGVGGDVYVAGKIVAQELDIQYTTVTTVSIKTDDVFTTYNTSAAYSTTTGAVVVSGGIGVGGSMFVGGTVTATNAVITNVTLTNVVVTANLNMSSNKVTNMADPVADKDAVNKQYLYSRSIVLSMDISDGLSNSGIITYLNQIAPVSEYTTGTNARILCSTITVTSSTVSLSTTNGTFMITTSTSGTALTAATAIASVPTVSVSRVVKTFTIASGVWTFVS